jgi:hypothetical protein
LIGFEPATEEEEPGFLGFEGEDEGLGAGAVLDGIFGGVGAAFGRGGAGAAAVAFFGFEIFGVVHWLSYVQCGGRACGVPKILRVSC